MKDFNGAISDFEHILIKAKNNKALQARASYYLGKYYFEINKPDIAFPFIMQAISLDPDNAKFYHLRGCIHLAMGEFQKALEEDFDVIINDCSIYSNNPFLFWRIGIIECTKGNFETAHESFYLAIRKIKEKNNYANDLFVLMLKGMAELYIDNYDTAYEIFSRLVTINPKLKSDTLLQHLLLKLQKINEVNHQNLEKLCLPSIEEVRLKNRKR